jgi:hypothetical protein
MKIGKTKKSNEKNKRNEIVSKIKKKIKKK